MALKTMPCKTCTKKPHDDYKQCSNCGYCFSMYTTVKTWKDGDTHKTQKPWEFCPLCGERA